MPSLYMDLLTILWMSYLTNALLALILTLAGPRFRGAWLWVGASFVMALATIGDSLPPSVPSWIPLVMGNSLYALANLLYIHASWSFSTDRPFHPLAYLAFPIQLTSFWWAFGVNYLARTLVFSFWMTLGPLVTAIILLRNPRKTHRGGIYLTGLPFMVLGIASLLRFIIIVGSPSGSPVEPVSELNVTYVGGAILLSTIMLFGYYMMTSTRNQAILEEKDRDIKARNRQLMEAHRSKDLFFAIVAHDLRAPIGGAARYVRKHLFGKMSGLEEKYQEVEILAASLEKTHDFLEKLLWWSRAQLDDWAPAAGPMDLETCFASALATVDNLARLKNVRILQDPPPYPQLKADQESMQLVVANLLSNAIKYSHPDQEVRIMTETKGPRGLVIIEDQGIGMDPTTLDRLFRIESKLSTMGTQNESGSGLGLILTKSLVERNGGTISLESSLGRGTRVTVSMALAGEEGAGEDLGPLAEV